MKKLKKVIIVLLILAIIVFICILMLKNKTHKDETESTLSDRTQDFVKEMDIVSDYGTYFSVEKMLNNYIAKVASENKEATYSMLDNTYIKNSKISRDNVLDKIPSITRKANNVRIRRIYRQTNMNNAVYYVYCILDNNGVGEESFFVLYRDVQNSTFSIEHISKENFVNQIKNAKEELEEKTIKKNEYNTAVNQYPSEEERANKYFKDFIENAVYDVEYAYKMLDKDYKNKRFPTLKDFKEYIEGKGDIYKAAVTQKSHTDFENMEDYVMYISKKQRLKLQGYQIRYENDYTRYVCIDSYNNYYVFYAKSPLNYTIMLDTYTIDMPEFIEKYEAGTTEEKVAYNIQKIVEALNCNDYKYIYSKLADEFKSNYFKNYEDFEKYAKKTFSIKNEVTFNKYTEADNLSTYQITLKGQSKTVTKTIVMRLEEGTDFVMSFNVE